MDDFETERFGDFMGDPEFVEHSRTMHKLFVERMADFTAFDVTLNAAFAGVWQLSINELANHPSDEVMRDDLENFTNELTKQHQLSWEAMDQLEYYARRAFPGNLRKMREFGFLLSKRERERGVLKLVLNMFTMKRVANDYIPQLTAVGMPAGMLTAFETVCNDLGDAEIEQEYAKRLQMRATDKRIRLFNTAYLHKKRVHDAAQVVYRSDEESRRLFAMG